MLPSSSISSTRVVGAHVLFYHHVGNGYRHLPEFQRKRGLLNTALVHFRPVFQLILLQKVDLVDSWEDWSWIENCFFSVSQGLSHQNGLLQDCLYNSTDTVSTQLDCDVRWKKSYPLKLGWVLAFRGFNFIVNRCTVLIHDLRLPHVLHASHPSLAWYRHPRARAQACKQANMHLANVAIDKIKHHLCNAMLLKHERMRESSNLELRPMRKHSGSGSFDDVRAKSMLKVVWSFWISHSWDFYWWSQG